MNEIMSTIKKKLSLEKMHFLCLLWSLTSFHCGKLQSCEVEASPLVINSSNPVAVIPVGGIADILLGLECDGCFRGEEKGMQYEDRGKLSNGFRVIACEETSSAYHNGRDPFYGCYVCILQEKNGRLVVTDKLHKACIGIEGSSIITASLASEKGICDFVASRSPEFKRRYDALSEDAIGMLDGIFDTFPTFSYYSSVNTEGKIEEPVLLRFEKFDGNPCWNGVYHPDDLEKYAFRLLDEANNRLIPNEKEGLCRTLE